MAAALAITAGVTAGGGAAGASGLQAQSVGRFLDGEAGGTPIQTLVDLKDARATSPGTQTKQNPLDATLLGQADIPLSDALKLPGDGALQLGAANQVAVARANGYSYGASGAVANSGGVSVGGNDNTYPSDATIKLSDASLGAVTIPGLPALPAVPGIPAVLNIPAVPGIPAVPAVPSTSKAGLGSVQASIGAVAAIAKTDTSRDLSSPTYQLGDFDLVLASPALGALLEQLAAGGAEFNTLVAGIKQTLAGQTIPIPVPSSCSLSSGTLPTHPISLDGGAVTLDPSNGRVTVSLAKLLKQLHADINALPPNTDLLAYVLHNLSTILSTGLESVVAGFTDPLQELGSTCLSSTGPLGTVLTTVLSSAVTGRSQLESAINDIATALSDSGGGGLDALTAGLGQVADIGANVQQGGYPLSSAAAPKYKFTSSLAATADQADAPIDGQGVVRALEIDLLNPSSLTPPAALAPARATSGAQIALALGNAAAGPGVAPASVAAATTAPALGVAGVSAAASGASAVPTAIPAGQAKLGGGAPVLPLVLVLLGLLLAGGGVLGHRLRTKPSH